MEECERGEIDFIGSSRFTIEFSALFFFHDDSILLLSSSFPVWISDSLRCDLRFSIVFRRRQASSIFHPYRIKSKD